MLCYLLVSTGAKQPSALAPAAGQSGCLWQVTRTARVKPVLRCCYPQVFASVWGCPRRGQGLCPHPWSVEQCSATAGCTPRCACRQGPPSGLSSPQLFSFSQNKPSGPVHVFPPSCYYFFSKRAKVAALVAPLERADSSVRFSAASCVLSNSITSFFFSCVDTGPLLPYFDDDVSTKVDPGRGLPSIGKRTEARLSLKWGDLKCVFPGGALWLPSVSLN